MRGIESNWWYANALGESPAGFGGAGIDWLQRFASVPVLET